MASSTSDHSHSFTYPDEGDTGWTSTMVTFFQDLSNDLDSIGTTEITLIDDANGNEMMAFSATANAINHIQLANAATGTSPVLSAVGDDTNIGITLTPKGSGQLTFDGVTWPAADGTANQVLKTDGAGALAWASLTSLYNVVDDTTPQLGGQLDVNGNAIGDGTRELVTFTESGTAVNHINIANAATGSAPIISVAGDDTNIGLTLQAKGTGAITLLDGNGNELLVTETVASAQNYLHLANSTSSVTLEPRGDDTNINLVLDAKGSGEIICNQPAVITQINSPLSDEILTLTDTGASDVNYLDILSTPTGTAPTLSAQGDDAAVGLNLASKSSGAVTLLTDSTSRMDITNSGVRMGAANARVTTILDEDNMASDSATALATQQSIKAYVDGLTFSLLDEDNMASNSATAAPSQQSVKAYVDAENVGSWDVVSTTSISNDATVDISLSGGYDEYQLVFIDVIPVTDDTSFRMRISDDSGSTYETTAYAFTTFFVDSSYDSTESLVGGYYASSAFQVFISSTVGNTAGEGLTGHMYITDDHRARWSFQWKDATGDIYWGNGTMDRGSAAFTNVRFYCSSGNVSGGTIQLLGRNFS